MDASGQARLDDEVGTGNDRFTSEVEIAKADFADLGITPGNGFRDEVVELRVPSWRRADFHANHGAPNKITGGGFFVCR